jgi:hypothetical protein
MLLALASVTAFADPAFKVEGNFVRVLDADYVTWVCDDTTYTIVYNDGHPSGMLVAGNCWLPEGAALPYEAMKYDAGETGLFSGCFLPGDESHFVVTPSGRVNFQCRVISD